MAWNETAHAHSGETQDATAEQLPSGVVLQTLRTQTGVRGFQHNLDVSANPCALQVLSGFGVDSGLVAAHCAIGLDVAPSSEIILWHNLGVKFAAIGIDRKIYLYTRDGTVIGTSTTLIPTAGLQELYIFWDGLTQERVWISVFFGATQELALDSGRTFTNFSGGGVGELKFCENLAAGTNRGCKLYSDDIYARKSPTAGDATHLTAYPRVRIHGAAQQMPTSEGTYHAWTCDENPSPNSYLSVDDIANDGDTTNVYTATRNIRHTFKSSSANPIPAGATIIKVQLRDVGRLLSGAKFGAHFMMRRGGSDIIGGAHGATSGTTSYGGGLDSSNFVSGWVQGDFNANATEFGWESENNAAIESGPRITNTYGPEVVYYTASLPLSTAPGNESLVMPRQVTVASGNSLLRR